MNRRAVGVGLIASGLSMTAIGAVLVLVDDHGSPTQSASSTDATPPETRAQATTTPATTTTATTTPGTATQAAPTTQAPTTQTPTTQTPTTQAPTTLPPAETPVEFLAAFVDAQSVSDTDFLVDRLHPAVFERYERSDCAAYLDGVRVTGPGAEVLSVGGPALWSWMTDDIARDIDEALTVRVRRTEDAGVTYIESDVHFVVGGGGLIRWFTDCGTPKAGAQ